MNARTICSLLLAATTFAACSARSVGPAELPAGPDVAIAPPLVRDGTIEIVGTGENQKLDDLVVAFMKTYEVPNAQLAVSPRDGPIFSHAYTYVGLAKSTTTRQTIMRIASDTKPWTSAAIYRLARDGKPPLDIDAPVFPYLGITQPLRPGDEGRSPYHDHHDSRT